MQQRGALLRRLLATGDWLVTIAALCVATAATSSADVATLFWAALFSPVVILVFKIQGLYDHDHRRIRHSTLDELPALVSASALGVLALDGLLSLTPAGALAANAAIGLGVGVLGGSFAMRAAIRFVWHRAVGAATGLVIGPALAADQIARRVSTHPEARLEIVGYVSASEASASPGGLPRLGTVAELRRIAEEQGIERVIVTEDEMGETAAERLIEDCKAAGLGLTFLPRHHGLLGPGIELNRLAELPLARLSLLRPLALDGGDEADDGRRDLRPAAGRAGAALRRDRDPDPARLGPAGPLPPAPRGQGRGAVHGAQVPHHGRRRGGAPGRTSGSTSRRSRSPPSRWSTTRG